MHRALQFRVFGTAVNYQLYPHGSSGTVLHDYYSPVQ